MGWFNWCCEPPPYESLFHFPLRNCQTPISPYESVDLPLESATDSTSESAYDTDSKRKGAQRPSLPEYFHGGETREASEHPGPQGQRISGEIGSRSK